MTSEEIQEKFGFDPNDIGIRGHGFYIIEQIDEIDAVMGAVLGDLVVCTRDGADNLVDETVEDIDCFYGSIEDWGDSTYLYYYFRAPENQ